MYSRILVPTDGSEGATEAVEHAVGLAVAHDAALHTIYVIETDVGLDAGVVGTIDALAEAGEDAIDDVVERAEAAGVESVEGTVVEGRPHRAILEYADEHDADLVVMGTHGRTGLDRYLLGSVTEKVVRTSEVPVLTVTAPTGSNGDGS